MNNFWQLSLPIDVGIKIDETDPVRLLVSICEELNYSNLFKAYGRHWRKVHPVTMFELLVFGYMNNIYSSRDLELACKTDIRFMWLLQGKSVPDHSTFARFQNEKLTTVIEDLFYQLVNKLAKSQSRKAIKKDM